MSDDRQIKVEKDGRLLAQAELSVSKRTNEARAQVHVAPGQLPSGTRQRMADALHDAVTEDRATHLTASVPLGDAELVQGLREHLDDVELRAAGATSIIEGSVKRT